MLQIGSLGNRPSGEGHSDAFSAVDDFVIRQNEQTLPVLCDNESGGAAAVRIRDMEPVLRGGDPGYRHERGLDRLRGLPHCFMDQLILIHGFFRGIDRGNRFVLVRIVLRR